MGLKTRKEGGSKQRDRQSAQGLWWISFDRAQPLEIQDIEKKSLAAVHTSACVCTRLRISLTLLFWSGLTFINM